MRDLRYSKSFHIEFAALLAQGSLRFGRRVVKEKQAKVVDVIENILVPHPKRPIDPVLGICAYHVAKTPFVVLYDFDDSELRVHLIIHAKADRTLIDLSTVVW